RLLWELSYSGSRSILACPEPPKRRLDPQVAELGVTDVSGFRGISMDPLIAAAAQALAAGDPLAALKQVALREDAQARALRGIAMAQLGEFARARELLRSAARAFGPREPVPRARCVAAEAEIALVSRDLGRSIETLDAARTTRETHGDVANAGHAGELGAPLLRLVGGLDEGGR